MTIAEYLVAHKGELKVTNLVFLKREGQLLLAMKKRGFGAGRWNGPGGKLNVGETPEMSAAREVHEEIGVVTGELAEVATLKFYFEDDPNDPVKNIICHVYVCEEWKGEPIESEEMAPKWFSLDEIPYAEMWPDDEYWLPQMLDGKYVEAEFLFASGDVIRDMIVRIR
jgi:mutator protein MutT